MIVKKLFIAILCLALTLMLAGCGNAGNAVSEAGSKAGEVMSDIGRDESSMISRAESFVEGDESDTKDDSASSKAEKEAESRADSEGLLLEDESSAHEEVSSDITASKIS